MSIEREQFKNVQTIAMKCAALESELAALREKNAEIQRQLDELAKQEPVTFGLWEYNDDPHNRESLAQRVFPFKEWAHEHINERASEATLKECGYTKWPTVVPLYRHPANLPALIEQAKQEEREAVRDYDIELLVSVLAYIPTNEPTLSKDLNDLIYALCEKRDADLAEKRKP